jgi:RNA polymerase sigma-70 factor, ECF subfamily
VRIFRSDNSAPPPAGPERDQWVANLCDRMAEGNEEAFEQFFRTYADRLYRLSITLTRGNEDLSRELVQSAIIRCARKTPHCVSEQKLWAWLSQVVRNSFIDHLRLGQNQSFDAVSLTDEWEGRSPDADAEMMQALNESVEELASEERWLIECLYEKRMSHAAVAELRKTTPKAVENRIGRLRCTLREAILKKLKSYALF